MYISPSPYPHIVPHTQTFIYYAAIGILGQALEIKQGAQTPGGLPHHTLPLYKHTPIPLYRYGLLV